MSSAAPTEKTRAAPVSNRKPQSNAPSTSRSDLSAANPGPLDLPAISRQGTKWPGYQRTTDHLPCAKALHDGSSSSHRGESSWPACSTTLSVLLGGSFL